MPSGADIIRAQWAAERATPKFDPRQPRVSAIGLCVYRQVSRALGNHVEPEFPWIYGEAGHLLQYGAFMRIKAAYPDAENEVSVETVIPGVYCHPDIIIPSLKKCIQVKSADASSATYGNATPYQVDQCLMEWVSWQHSRQWTSEDGLRSGEFVPAEYEVLIRDRESYGRPDLDVSVPVRWDPNRARLLTAKFHEIDFYISAEILPQKPAKRQFDCWFSTENHCVLFENCWR